MQTMVVTLKLRFAFNQKLFSCKWVKMKLEQSSPVQ
jgi:hypothetical protein